MAPLKSEHPTDSPPSHLFVEIDFCSNCESELICECKAMAKFDYNHAREEIAQINAIVDSCPDAVKEKCFELLFAAVFGAANSPTTRAEAPSPPKEPEKPVGPVPPQTKKLPSNVLAFTRSTA